MLLHFYMVREDHKHKVVFLWKSFNIMLSYRNRITAVYKFLVLQFTKKIQQDATVYQNFISYLYKAQHVSGDTPPIIRSLKLH